MECPQKIHSKILARFLAEDHQKSMIPAHSYQTFRGKVRKLDENINYYWVVI